MKNSSLFLVAATLLALTPGATAQPKKNIYIRHNLISDLPGEGERRDTNLANPWGIAASATGPFWVADNKTGVSTVYSTDGKGFPADNPLIVKIPAAAGGTDPAAPTGIVFNSTSSFAAAPGKPGLFIFATEDGTLSAWNPTVDPTNAILRADNSQSGAIYKGLAIGNNGSLDLLYATNFNAGSVDVFDTNFTHVPVPGGFSDPTLPAGYAPFGIRNINGKLYVTYALQDADKEDDVRGPGNGYVNVFDMNGFLIRRLITRGNLNSPWGIALAPANFGDLSGALLIGNFGDGTIFGYDPATGAQLGQVLEPSGKPVVIQGLWALQFGNGGLGGEASVLYFTAGIAGSGEVEDHGQFGELRPQHP